MDCWIPQELIVDIGGCELPLFGIETYRVQAGSERVHILPKPTLRLRCIKQEEHLSPRERVIWARVRAP